MRKLPSLKGLRAFDAAARLLNFRLAAEEMNVSQGAVAQQVRRLEDELGVRLFRREARGLSLTAEGRNYHPAIRRAFSEMEAATARIFPAPERVTLSAPPSFASKWLTPRLARFSEENPSIELRTVATETLSDFRTDGVDVAIRQGERPRRAALAAKFLAPLDLVVVDAPVREDARGLGGFAKAPIILDGHDHWRELFAAAELVHAGRETKFNQTALAIDAAANGLGAAVAPAILVEYDIAAGRIKVVWRPEAVGDQGFYLIHPVSGDRPARRAVVDWIVSEFAGCAPQSNR